MNAWRTLAVMLLCFGWFTLPANEEGAYRTLYGVNFFDGKTWDSTIVPPSAATIYLLADREHALVVRETWLYYWPLTGEYRADWAVRNLPLAGTLVVTGGGGTQRIARDVYVIQHDRHGPRERSSIHWGAAAITAYETFTKRRDDYVLEMQRFHRAQREHEAQVYALLRDPKRSSAAYPEPPIEPSPFQLVSTEPHYGYRIDLPAGRYRIVLETPDGRQVKETRKRLEVFEPLEDGAPGVLVFEEQRWTVPAALPGAHRYLYSVPGASLYFQPYTFARFDHHAYEMMKNPQATFTRDKLFAWIPIAVDDSIDKIAIGADIATLSGYRVDQIAGSRVGYRIDPVSRTDAAASFVAARFDVNESHARSTFRIGDSGMLAVLETGGSSAIELILILLCAIPLGLRAGIGIRRIHTNAKRTTR